MYSAAFLRRGRGSHLPVYCGVLTLVAVKLALVLKHRTPKLPETWLKSLMESARAQPFLEQFSTFSEQ